MRHLACSGNLSGCSMVSTPKSISRSGQYKCSWLCSSAFNTFPIGASLNHGKSSYGMNSSRAPSNSHTPWLEIFVTSTPEEAIPCGFEFIAAS